MNFLKSILGLFSSKDAPAVPVPEGGTTAQPAKSFATQDPVTSTKASKARKATESLGTEKVMADEAPQSTKPSTKEEQKQEALKHTVANEQTIERMRKMYNDTFSVYNSDGTLNVQATMAEFNNQKAMGLLDEKRNIKDWSDKRNWDDALKMLANWAPQAPSVLFRGQGGNKIYQRK